MSASYAGLLLRAVRERAGVGLQEMAAVVGHEPRDLSRIERGARGWRVTPAVVKVYEEVLDMPLAGAVARLTDLGVDPAPVPVVGCALAGPQAWEPVAEPLRRLVETVHLLAWELRFLRGGGSKNDHVEGRADFGE